MNACTIIAKNYLAHARVLAHSFAEHHPDGRFFVLIIDEIDGYVDPSEESFEVVLPSQIGLEAWNEMRGAYDVLELSTAVKPWLLRWLLQEHDDGTGTAYLDPDIRVLSRMSELEETLQHHSAVLTPHVTQGMPRDGMKPSEADILLAGVYNLGFIGLSNSAPAHKLLDWWSERLLTDCHVAPERALFVDQRWVDFVPGLVAELDIFRDPTYNVAYWNLPERPLSRKADGTFTTHDRPLRFYHFSGYGPDARETLSRHQTRVRLVDDPVLSELCFAYADALEAHGYRAVREYPYDHDLLPSGTRLTGLMRSLYRSGVEALELPESLFTSGGEAEFLAWLNEPAPDEPGLSRFLHAVWLRRPDVQRAYPEPGGADRSGFLGWCVVHGREQIGIPFSLLAADPQEQNSAPDEAPAPTPAVERVAPELPFGANVAGYLRSELGIGEVARQLITALDAVGFPVLPVGLTAPLSRQGHAYATTDADRNPFAVNLICVNADGLPAFAEEAGAAFFDGKYNVGFWWWETDTFPQKDMAAFEHVDEVWVGSSFIADALAEVSPVPVVHVPVALDFAMATPLEPGALGLPDAFTFLFSYDYNSVASRKNPLGALEAYMRAFGPDDGTALVLKSINGQTHPSQHKRVVEMAAERPDVLVLDDYLEQSQKDRLMASCDCYLSLHRSEGFGLTLAEAMFLGKPVIATNYSGNTDFMTAENSYPVDYELRRIGAGAEPYPADGEWAEPDLAHAVSLMREVRADPKAAEARGARAASDIRAQYAPDVAGRAMAARLARIAARVPSVDTTQPAVIEHRDVTGLIARAGSPGAPSRFGKPGAAVRKAALRAMKPYTSYQHDVNQALVERESALAQAQQAAARQADERLTTALASVMAELRRQRTTLGRHDAALAAEGRTEVVRAVEARVDDLARQVDGLRSLLDRHEARLESVGLGVAPGSLDPVRLAGAPDVEPWSEAYTEAHREFVAAALDDPILLDRFRGDNALPGEYGRGFDERVVEYPWLSSQRLGGLVLDAGSVLNHPHVLTRLRLRMDDLHILTLEPEAEAFPQLHVSYLYADLRSLPIADATYDRVLSISTLEHVGMDNAYYGSDAAKAPDPQPELLRALGELRRVLKPGGDLYLTVPAGEPDRFEWVRALSVDEIDEIVAAFAPSSVTVTYFRHVAHGWTRVDRDQVTGARYRDHFGGERREDRVVAAEAVACLHLVKPATN
ncbi:MAG: glycosyltransferase [Solirubrobacterales bacterium]|nr:glycosyltransferase [Solirubrobacterales bacterium]